jgi:hypothetical protein
MTNAQKAVFSEGKWPFQSGNADVAQLVEQRFRKPQVTGSNPVVGSGRYMSAVGLASSRKRGSCP